MRLQRSAMAGVAIAVAGCGLPAEGAGAPPEPGEAAQSIIGGDRAPNREAIVAFRFQIEDSSGAYYGICSGALVAPNLVLTARHCVARLKKPTLCDSLGRDWDLWGNPVDAVDVGFGSLYEPSQMLVSPLAAVPFDGSWDGAARVESIFHVEDPSICRADVALLLLDRKLEGVRPVPIAMRAPIPGDLIDIVGFGVSEAGPAAAQIELARRERASVPVLRTGPAKADWFGPPVPFGFFQIGEAVCYGDSGGPALDARTGAVLGVASSVANFNVDSDTTRGPAVCIGTDVRAYYADLRYSELAIEQAFEAAGYEPWFEGEPEPSWSPETYAAPAPAGCATVGPPASREAFWGWLPALAFVAGSLARRRRLPRGRLEGRHAANSG